MTSIDWIVAGVIAISALIGLRRGLIGGLLGLAGIVVGAYLGAKLAPEFLSDRESPYTPLVALGGAVMLVILFQSIASMAGRAIRTSLFVLPPLRWLDSLGGLVLGAIAGAAIVWVMGAVALHLPGQRELREDVQRSRILGEINARVPPSRLLDAIERVDPFLTIRGPEANVAPPDPALLASPAVRAVRDSVFRVTGSACGLGVSGSGWAAAPNLVVTNAHVVAGMKDPRVDRRDGDYRDAVVVAFDVRDDIAVLRVAGLGATPLEAVTPVAGQAVAILGYPESGPFRAAAGRIGQTSSVLTEGNCVRAWPGQSQDHDAARGHPPRQLRRAGGRHPWARADNRVCLARRGRRPGVWSAGRAGPREAGRCARRRQGLGRPLRALRGSRGRRGSRAGAGTVPPGRRLRPSARLLDQLTGRRLTGLGRVRPGRSQPFLYGLRHDDARDLVVDPDRELQARHRPDSDQQRDRRASAEVGEERVEVAEVEQDLSHPELRAGLELALEPLQLEVEVVGRWLTAMLTKNEVGASIPRPW